MPVSLCTHTEAEHCPQTPGSVWVICVVLYFPLYSVKSFRLTSFSQAISVSQRKEKAYAVIPTDPQRLKY